MSEEEIANKVEEYSRFVSGKLRPELGRAEKSLKDTIVEIEEYNDLVQRLKGFQKEKKTEMDTTVNLGHETIYCKAVGKLDMIYIHVGMGFHVEMTIPEAIQFVQARLTFLKNDVLKRRQVKVLEINNHIVAASAILDELHQDWQRLR